MQTDTVYLCALPHTTKKKKAAHTISVVWEKGKNGGAVVHERDRTFPVIVSADDTNKKRTTLEAGHHMVSSLVMRAQQEKKGEIPLARSQVVVYVGDDACHNLFKGALKFAQSGQRPGSRYSWMRGQEWSLLKLYGKALVILENFGIDIVHVWMTSDLSNTVASSLPPSPKRPSQTDERAIAALMLFKADLAKEDADWHARYNSQAESHTKAAAGNPKPARAAGHAPHPAGGTSSTIVYDELVAAFAQQEELNNRIAELQTNLAEAQDEYNKFAAAEGTVNKAKATEIRQDMLALSAQIWDEQEKLNVLHASTHQRIEASVADPATPKQPVPSAPSLRQIKKIVGTTVPMPLANTPSGRDKDSNVAPDTSLLRKEACDAVEDKESARDPAKDVQKAVDEAKAADAGDVRASSDVDIVRQFKRPADAMEAHDRIAEGADEVVANPVVVASPSKKPRM